MPSYDNQSVRQVIVEDPGQTTISQHRAIERIALFAEDGTPINIQDLLDRIVALETP